MLRGPRVLRVEWMPGTDRLVGTCFCGMSQETEDPIAMWDWLLAHEEGHGDGGTDFPPPRADPSIPLALLLAGL